MRSSVEDALGQIAEGIYGIKSHFVRERDELEYVPTMSREEAEEAFASDDASWARAALYALIQYDPDWRRTQERCLRLIHHFDSDVRKDAVEGLDWIVSIHGVLEFDSVVPVLKKLLKTPELAKEARETLEGIENIRSGRAKPSG